MNECQNVHARWTIEKSQMLSVDTNPDRQTETECERETANE